GRGAAIDSDQLGDGLPVDRRDFVNAHRVLLHIAAVVQIIDARDALIGELVARLLREGSSGFESADDVLRRRRAQGLRGKQAQEQKSAERLVEGHFIQHLLAFPTRWCWEPEYRVPLISSWPGHGRLWRPWRGIRVP